MSASSKDWNPETYARFRDLRLRPALDLLAKIGILPDGDVVDLGCGNGAVGPPLALRWPDRTRIGLDNSPAMLAKAAETGCYTRLIEADARLWCPDRPPALIFSNAALQWLPDHAALLPRLTSLLPPGGVLAVQMPRQFDAPSHRLLRDLAAQMFPDRFDFHAWRAPVDPPEVYWHLLSPLGQVLVWETDYLQHLNAAETGHPVRHFTESTALRPFLERLGADEATQFIAAYDAALAGPYPLLPNGGALFPFRRLFLLLTV